MFRVSFTLSLLLSTFVLGCGSKDDEDTDLDEVLLMPQAGEWSIVTTGYTNDDCNADGFLIPFDSITVADVGTTSFSITYYLENERIGDSSTNCSHTSEETFDCEELAHSTPWSATTTINMTAIGSVNLTSETSISGAGNLVLDCTGNDCDQLKSMTATGNLPCETTLNWTATAN